MDNNNEKFLNDQTAATKMAKELLDEEHATDSLNADSLQFAMTYHANFTPTNPKIEEVLKTAKIIKKYLQKI